MWLRQIESEIKLRFERVYKELIRWQLQLCSTVLHIITHSDTVYWSVLLFVPQLTHSTGATLQPKIYLLCCAILQRGKEICDQVIQKISPVKSSTTSKYHCFRHFGNNFPIRVFYWIFAVYVHLPISVR